MSNHISSTLGVSSPSLDLPPAGAPTARRGSSATLGSMEGLSRKRKTPENDASTRRPLADLPHNAQSGSTREFQKETAHTKSWGTPAPAKADQENQPFQAHIQKPDSGTKHSIRRGKTHELHTPHTQLSTQAGAWAHSVHSAGRQGLGFSATGYGEAGVGLQAEAHAAKENRLLKGDAEGSVTLGATAQGAGRLEANRQGVNLSGELAAQVGLDAQSEVELRAKLPTSIAPNLRASGHALAGAESHSELFVGIKKPTDAQREAGASAQVGLNAGATAFAGAKAEGSASAGIGRNRIVMKGGVWAGAGAEATLHGNLAKEDGHTVLKFGGDLGASVGVGGKLGLNVQVGLPAVDVAEKVVKKLKRSFSSHAQSSAPKSL